MTTCLKSADFPDKIHFADVHRDRESRPDPPQIRLNNEPNGGKAEAVITIQMAAKIYH